MSDVKKSVASFQTVNSCFVSGISKALPSTISKQALPGIKMEVIAPGVLCEMRGLRFIVPFSNCKVIVLERDHNEVVETPVTPSETKPQSASEASDEHPGRTRIRPGNK